MTQRTQNLRVGHRADARGGSGRGRSGRLLPYLVGSLLVILPATGVWAHGEHDYGDCRTFHERYPGVEVYLPPTSDEGGSFPLYVVWNWWYLSGHGYSYQYGPMIYQESNDVAGLQRHDLVCYDVDGNGEPYTDATADTLIF